MIGIINYGLGNLFSVQKAFNRLGLKTKIISDPNDIRQVDKLILPGVGYFSFGMEKLKSLNWLETLNEKVLREKTPILGICLGMQLMTKKSQEGEATGLGWFDAETIRFDFNDLNEAPKIPHMGWNTVDFIKDHPLFAGIAEEAYFYFAHSYYVKLNDKSDLLGATEYGLKFASIINRDNLYGVQFHPEKSHKNGLQLLKNFGNL